MNKFQVCILIFLISFVSCKKEVTYNSFDGLGKLKLSSKFKDFKDKDLFILNSDLGIITHDSVYYINKYEINNDFGIVENLEIGVENGQIFIVGFLEGPYTKGENIMSYFEKKLKFQDQKYEDVFDYESPYSNVKANIKYFRNENKTRYTYLDNSIYDNMYNKGDSIETIQRKIEAEKKKKDYMRDMPIKK